MSESASKSEKLSKSAVLKHVESNRVSAFPAPVIENGNIEGIAGRYESYNASIVRPA